MIRTMSNVAELAPRMPGRVPTDSFALRLMLMRAELGLSIEEAAERCGLAMSTWATWERGTKPQRMDEKVRLISEGLGYDRGWIMFGGPLAAPGGPDTPSGLGVTPSGDKTNSTATITVLYPVSAAA